MIMFDGLTGPIAPIVDQVIPNPAECNTVKPELPQLQSPQELAGIQAGFSAIVAGASLHDPWIGPARPSFLYVMPSSYSRFRCGRWRWQIIAAFRLATAQPIAQGMNARLNGLPQPHSALFGTDWPGYAAARP